MVGFWRVVAACLSVAWIAAPYAQQATVEQEATKEDASEAVWKAAGETMEHGPAVIKLGDQAQLTLAEGYSFVPKAEAAAIMKLIGNRTDERFLGLVLPDAQASWMAMIDFEASGYIKDDDARAWDSDDLLAGLKAGTEAGNQQRVKQGIPPLEVTRWIEAPIYESPQHRLIWSAEARKVGVDNQDPPINYNTFLLGREGYLSLNLITSGSQIEKDKPVARQLLGALEFKEGKRYADFDAKTDKVAAFGLAALVGGYAMDRMSFGARAGLLVSEYYKYLLIGLAIVAALVARRFFSQRRLA